MASKNLHTGGGKPFGPRRASQAERLWTPLFVFVVGMTLCCYMVGQGLNSGTSVYLARSGDGATFAGVLAAVFSAAAALARIVCGPLIDRSGRFLVMMAGAALLFAGTIIPAFVSDGAVFTLCRVLQGVGFSAATTASATAAADILPPSRLGEGIGYYGLGQALAMSVGPALALFLAGTDPAENLYLGLAAVAALGIALTACCRYEDRPQRLPASCAWRRKLEGRASDGEDSPQGKPEGPEGRGLRRVFETRALPGTLPMLVLSPAFGFGIFFVGLYGTSLGIGNAGLFYTISAVSMVAVRLKSKSFMDRVAPIKVFLASVLCGLGAFGLLLATPLAPPLYYLAGLLYGIFTGIGMPINQSVAVKNTPARRWGAANALYFLAADIGIGFSSTIWGVINDTCGFAPSILCAMGCIAAAFAVAWFAYPKRS